MLEKLILYFVEKTKGYITKTQLVKFLYLADLYAVKWTGKQLTELDWRFYKYGPWHEEIDTVLNNLKENNQLCEVPFKNGTLIKLTVDGNCFKDNLGNWSERIGQLDKNDQEEIKKRLRYYLNLNNKLDDDWFKKNASPELLKKVFEQIPDDNKEEALNKLLDNLH